MTGSDPNGELNHKDVITGTALYYLTKSFQSSVFIYGFNPHGFQTTIRKANTTAPLAYGDFKWDVGYVRNAQNETQLYLLEPS